MPSSQLVRLRAVLRTGSRSKRSGHFGIACASPSGRTPSHNFACHARLAPAGKELSLRVELGFFPAVMSAAWAMRFERGRPNAPHRRIPSCVSNANSRLGKNSEIHTTTLRLWFLEGARSASVQTFALPVPPLHSRSHLEVIGKV